MTVTEPLTPVWVAGLRTDVDEWGPSFLGPDEVTHLLATVEAQAEVIERFKDGWQFEEMPHETDELGVWFQYYDNGRRVVTEPMPPAHQLVLWGEVVREESE